MSGVWGGWMRRLRRGQATGSTQVEAEADEAPDEAAPTPAAGVEARPAEAHPGAPDRLDEGDDPDDDPDDNPDDETFAFTPAPPAARAPEPAAPAPQVSVEDLLRRGDLAASQAAVARGEDAWLAPLVAALADGEAVLRRLSLGGSGGGSGGGGAEISVMLAPAKGARGLLLVFGEDGGGFHLAPPPPGGPVHVLYLRDGRHSVAMLGVDGLGEDYDACLLGILRIARALDAADLFCLGGGAACYSALRYGLDLGAAGVLAAGNLDHLRRGVVSPGLRPGAQARRLMRLAADLGAGMAGAYAAAPARPGLVLCRPGQGALAGLAALPGSVSVEAPPGALGKILAWAEQNGRMRGMMRDLLACRPVG